MTSLSHSATGPTALEKLLGVKEAAEILDVSEDWVRDHAAPRPGQEARRTPTIPVVRLGGGTRARLKFRRSDLKAFIRGVRFERVSITTLAEPETNPDQSYPCAGILKQIMCSEERFAAAKVEQNGCCAICGRNDRRLNIDHCHKTDDLGKAFRGLLCGHCNRGIGMFADSPDLLRAAALYLEKHQK